jgi:hypothetical protein
MIGSAATCFKPQRAKTQGRIESRLAMILGKELSCQFQALCPRDSHAKGEQSDCQYVDQRKDGRHFVHPDSQQCMQTVQRRNLFCNVPRTPRPAAKKMNFLEATFNVVITLIS